MEPFIRSFNTSDDEGFKAVHSKEVIRVLQDDKDIFGYDRYFQRQPDSVKVKWRAWKRNIELRFTQRIAGNDKAFDTHQDLPNSILLTHHAKPGTARAVKNPITRKILK